MNFEEHINKEGFTIKEFIDLNESISIKTIVNESYSRYDFVFYSAGTYNGYFIPQVEGITEVKTRSYDSDEFYGGVLIELDKITAILSEVARLKSDVNNVNKIIKGFYLVKYTDKTFLFDLEKVNLGLIEFKKCPKHTASNGYNGWISKPVIMLDPEESVIKY